jgi:hypothetical protein
MFPVGFWMMRRALSRTGRSAVLAGVPAVAAAVKLADLLLPVRDPFIVINPAAAILLEGAALAVLLRRSGERAPSPPSLAVASTAWRVAYLAWGSASASLAGAPNAFALAGFSPWRFFAVDPLVAAMLIAAALGAARARAAARAGTVRRRPAGPLDRWASSPARAAASLVLAAAVEIILRRG